MYTELDYVNACLGTMGEAPVPGLTVPHPYIGQALVLLARHNKLVQAVRWWFNTTKLTLTPSAGDFSASLPVGTISIIGISGNAYVLNGDGTVYDITRGEQVLSAITVWVLRELDFEELPPEANAYIADCAILQFQSNYDGDGSRTALLRENKRESWMQLHAMNTRMVKANLLRRPGVQSKLQDVRGDRPMLRGAE
jgi:hypothetical protein